MLKIKDYLNPDRETPYKRILVGRHNLQYKHIAKFIGQSKAHVANLLCNRDNITEANHAKLIMLIGLLEIEKEMEAEVNAD